MAGSGGIKSFVSETEVEEVRKKRQEEWEKIRKPDEPLERPEEVHDNRTLYERLQEQKDKKQEEWDEQHQLKNLFRGLDGEETEFLDMVSKQQQDVNKQRFDDESKELKEFRSAVSDLESTAVLQQKQVTRKSSQPSNKKSQMALISGAIKRKSSTSNEQSPDKKPKTEDGNQTSTHTEEQSQGQVITSDTNELESSSGDEVVAEDTSVPRRNPKVLVPRCRLYRTGRNLRQTLTIPGMGIYSDSSDSESSSSDSEIATTSTTIIRS